MDDLMFPSSKPLTNSRDRRVRLKRSSLDPARGLIYGESERLMGYINLKEEKENLARIKSALKRRGLTMKEDDEWEIHGPHAPDMNYQVLIGPAYRDGRWCCIAVIYPWAVYEAALSSDWWNVKPEDRIPVLKKK